MIEATAFRLAAALKFRADSVFTVPSTVIFIDPVVMLVKFDIACWAVDSAPPFRRAEDADLAQRPTYKIAGCGDWLKNRLAARYSGAEVPKSAATASSDEYWRMRSLVSITLDAPRMSSAPKSRVAAASGDMTTWTLTTPETARVGIDFSWNGQPGVTVTSADRMLST
ncbi:hypothetical protein D3C76_1367620 [compost metagenome]